MTTKDGRGRSVRYASKHKDDKLESLPYYSYQNTAMTTFLCFIVSLLLIISSSTADNEAELIFRLYRNYPEWRPAAIVDVGANRGGWTSRILNDLYDNDKTKYPPVLMIEATEIHRNSLQFAKEQLGADKVDFRIDVLADVDDRIVHFFQGKNTGNSLFRENTKHYANDIPAERKAVTLDTAIQQSFLASHRVDYLKLDVQGGELLVLQGATQLLQTVTFIQFEVSAVEYNSGGAACWSDLDQFLQQRGFRLFDLGDKVYNNDAFHTKGVGQLDVLYYRPDSSHRPTGLGGAKFCTPLFLAETTTTAATEPLQDMPFGIESLLLEDYFSLTQVGVFILVFTAGYLLGSWSSKRKRATRNVQRQLSTTRSSG